MGKKPKDIITQALLIGFGAMSLTRDKVEELIKDVKKERNINKKESEKAVKDLLKVLGIKVK